MAPPLDASESTIYSWNTDMIWALFLRIATAAAPATDIAIKYAQVVDIEESFVYQWSAEKEAISAATVLVLEIASNKVGLPPVGAPTLFVGGVPAARVHPGGPDNHVVVYVPGRPDLTKTPVFWGPSVLPERVTRHMGEQYTADIGGQSVGGNTVNEVLQPTISVANETALFRHMAVLIDRYAPKDGAYADGIRVTIQP